MKKSKIAHFLLTILQIVLCGGIVSLFFIPHLYDMFSEKAIRFLEYSIFFQTAFYLCYVICLAIIWILIRILKDVHLESPFKKETEINLKRIAVLFMLLAIIVLLKVIFVPTILSFAIIAFAFIASLSFYVLSQIIKMAIEYKHEVDYTV